MDRILVALDTSERAPAVLAYAAEMARRAGGRLVLFRAVPPPIDWPTQAFTVPFSHLGPMLLEQAREALTTLAAGVPAAAVERVEADLGPPWQAICAAARTVGADLIVIGSHGFGGLDRVLGTTAARVVDHADCPVLVVRNPAAHPL